MPIKYHGLALFDTTTIKFLKKKEFKSFPGGIFSIIFTTVNLAMLITIVLLFILEPTKMKSQISYITGSNIKNTKQIEDKINITILSQQFHDEETFQYINSHYKLIEYYRNENMEKINGRLYKGNIIQLNATSYAINYSISSNDVIIQKIDSDFPRLAIESCEVLKSSDLSYLVVIENSEVLNDCIIDDDPLQFYTHQNILNKIYIFSYSSDYHILESNYSIKSSINTYDISFSFQYNQFDSYITELNRIAFMVEGTDEANEYINWLYPDYQVLTKFNSNGHYSFHLLFSTNYHDLIILYTLYKNGFLYHLELLGTLGRVIDIFTCIPSLWIPYHASLVIIGLFWKRRKDADSNEIDLGIDDYNWENLKYSQWLSIRFGCSARNKRLNEKLIKMRILAIKQYEQLYSTPNKEKKTETIETELQIRDEV